MNRWKIRHEGSPDFRDGLTDAEVLQGVREGLWEPTDEVRGPHDAGWVPLESHPHFAEALADYEPPPPPHRPDETKLDMNPLIDVALVLLVFFILTTTYASLRRVMDLPNTNPEEKGVVSLKQEDVQKVALVVKARPVDGKPQIWIESEAVKESELEEKLGESIRRTGKNRILVDVEGVPWGTEVAILDAAKGAGVVDVLQKVSPPGKKK